MSLSCLPRLTPVALHRLFLCVLLRPVCNAFFGHFRPSQLHMLLMLRQAASLRATTSHATGEGHSLRLDWGLQRT
jgi:hypothetical protein